MKVKNILLLAFIVSTSATFSQVGINTDSPVSTLHIIGKPGDASVSDGIIAPKITRAELIAKTAYTSNQTGAIVYVTDLSGSTNASTVEIIEVGYYSFDGSVWKSMSRGDRFSFGDIKSGMQASDHNGWVKLDGRAKSTLTAAQQTQATLLGIGSSLPDATGVFLTQNGATLGAVTGSNSKTISRSNLPNFTMSGSTNSDTHNHGVGNGSTGTVSQGGLGLSRRSRSGESVTINNRDANGSGTEPDVDNAPRAIPNDTHSHTFSVSTGGSNVPLNITPRSLSVTMFIYLGK